MQNESYRASPRRRAHGWVRCPCGQDPLALRRLVTLTLPPGSHIGFFGHPLSAARLFEDEPQVKRGVEIGLIARVSDLVYVGDFVTSIGEHGIMKNIYVLTQKTELQDPPGRAVRRRCILRYCDILY